MAWADQLYYSVGKVCYLSDPNHGAGPDDSTSGANAVLPSAVLHSRPPHMQRMGDRRRFSFSGGGVADCPASRCLGLQGRLCGSALRSLLPCRAPVGNGVHLWLGGHPLLVRRPTLDAAAYEHRSACGRTSNSPGSFANLLAVEGCRVARAAGQR